MKFLDEKQILYNLLEERGEITFSDLTHHAIDLFKNNDNIAVDLSRDNILSIIDHCDLFEYKENKITLKKDNKNGLCNNF